MTLRDLLIERGLVKPRTHEEALRALRAHLSFFGCDTSEMSDEDIEQGVLRFHELARAVGVTTQEACEAVQAFARLAAPPEEK